MDDRSPAFSPAFEGGLSSFLVGERDRSDGRMSLSARPDLEDKVRQQVENVVAAFRSPRIFYTFAAGGTGFEGQSGRRVGHVCDRITGALELLDMIRFSVGNGKASGTKSSAHSSVLRSDGT